MLHKGVRGCRIGLMLLMAAGGCAKKPALLRTAQEGPAPEVFRVRFETSRGPFVVEAQRNWSPAGADRFHYLVRNGFYNENRFFRVVNGFMVQFGISGDPAVSAVWSERFIRDEPVVHGNERGTVTFATAGPNARSTQLFINYRDNRTLDAQGFTPIGRVVEGMEVVDSLYAGYGEGPPMGPRGPEQSRIVSEGNEYLKRDFPRLDYITTARIVTVRR
ncbi:MAG TPA: peptidylprolyl isomerase [Longimicrobium sp.]|jgi:peptidyl-prolyl cis-trans isomerase A (cyclophilin A)